MILRTGPRVRWPIEAKDTQSLLGIMVETAGENGHRDIGSILSFAGLSSTNGIGPAMRDPEARARLAYVLDQPVEVVDRRAHGLVDPIHGQTAVDFFGARVPARHIIYDRRRVGLTGLTDFHHHASWQFLGMPFCAESGAGVTDRCSTCGSRLGWRYAAHAGRCYAGTNRGGVDLDGRNCECSLPGRGANDHPLMIPEAQLKAMAPLTALIDPRPEVHVPARDALSADLRSEDRGIVFYLAARLGKALAFPYESVRSRTGTPRLLQDTATALQLGATVLAEWPDGVGRLLTEKASGCHEQCMAAVRAVKGVCYGLTAWPEHQRLMEAAMPGICRERDQKVLRASLVDVVDRRGAAAAIGVDPARIPQLVRRKVLTPVVSGGNQKMHGSFAVADLEPIAAALRDSMMAASAVEAWGTTFHGIEQLICTDRLTRSDHPAILALYPHLRITRSSFQLLSEQIEHTVERGSNASSFIPLRSALQRLGGREKPWAAIFERLVDGRLPHAFRARPGRLVDRLTVEDGQELRTALDVTFDRSAYPAFPFAPTMRRRDAIELLNINVNRFPEIEPLLGEEVHDRHKKLKVQPLLLIAGRIIDRAEARARWGVRLSDAEKVDGGLGWSRMQMEERWSASGHSRKA